MATIMAIGGEEIGELLSGGGVKPIVMEAVHKEVIARTGKRRPRVLFIPTAKDDSEGFIAGFREYYRSLGCSDIDVLRLIREKPSRADIKSKIFSADAIYVNGGDTFRMMRIWERYGVDKMLKQAHAQRIVMAGHSAGAICWFADGNSDSFYKHSIFRVTALDMVDALLCPHYDTEPVRQKALKKMMRRTPGVVAIALDEYAAIEIIDNEYRILAGTPAARARRTFWKHGEYIVEDIPRTEAFQELKSLLTKPI